jgi:hypothetical protein
MKTFLTLLLATLCAATSYGQTIKSLGFNSTNGQVIAATNVVWTNAFNFSTNTVAEQVRTNLGLGATWLTNTNVTNFRTAIGLGDTNDVTFKNLFVAGDYAPPSSGSLAQFGEAMDVFTNYIQASVPVYFGQAATTRTNLGLPLPALTNTSNVTAMRALSGSTNTNHPFSGSVSVVGTNNTNTLVFSNGILQAVQ